MDGEAAGDSSGTDTAISAGGDINGDGYEDLIVGAPSHNGNVGRSYVVFGGPTVGKNGLVPLSSLNGTNGFKLDGEKAGDNSAWSLAGIGDFNADGYSDLFVRAVYASPGSVNQAGRCYVVFGGPTVGNTGLIALSNLNGVNGFKLDGELASDRIGFIVGNTQWDVNGDGINDILFAGNGDNNVGRSYVVFGDIPPVLTTNQLNISVGVSVQINATHLSAYDLNHNNDTLLFIPIGVSHGRFESLNNPGIPLANFTQQ